jgi:type IV secretion system protein VirB10
VTSPARESPDAPLVKGERGEAVVNAARTVQSRVSSALAAGLVILLGVAALVWYYAHALTRQTRARAAAQSTAANRAQGEMPLPSLGPITPPAAVPARAPQGAPVASAADATPATAGTPAADLPLAQARSAGADWTAGTGAPAVFGGAPSSGSALAKTPADLARERRLAGGVFSRETDSAGVSPAVRRGVASAAAGSDAIAGAGAVAGMGAVAGSVPPQGESAEATRLPERSDGELSTWLKSGATALAQAQVLPTARFLLPKGAFIDCTLETAIDSTLPGMTTCITATDTFGADGKVVLLERGTKLVGETRGQVQQGQARVFVLWTEARTPAGVVVPLDSPGTDELGRSGLPGQVQRHFWERFGAAMLVSLVDGAVQAGVQATNRSGGAVIYAPSASQEVLTEVLKDTLRIAPTVVKRNGDRIQVLVARDLDFRAVYELRARTVR